MSEKIPDFGIPHVVVIDRSDLPRDYDSQRMPALRGGILSIEIVPRVLTLTLAILDDILVPMPYDNGEVSILLHSTFGDRLDGAPTTVSVFS